MGTLDWEQGTARIRWYDAKGKRKAIRLPGATRTKASETKGMIDALLEAQRLPGGLPPRLAQWVADLPPDLADDLADKGLIPRRASASLKAFLDEYIDGRIDAKPQTKVNWGHTQRNLVAFFGPEKSLGDVSEADADDFKLYLQGQGLSPDTIQKRCKNAKQFFKRAVKARIIPRNPLMT